MSKIQIKEEGATFTPKELADFLSAQILSSFGEVSQPLTILDPACGSANLLVAIKNRLSTSNLAHSFMGYDTNSEYINEAKIKMEDSHIIESKFVNQDFILESDYICSDLFSDVISDKKLADVVIANPPYVRTQTLGAEKSQIIAQKYGLSGKIDLYYPFLISMTNSLKHGGIIGVITSNRYLTTKSGGQIRKYLLENYEVIKVIDLGDTKLFDAAVLPAIFIGRKKDNATVLSGEMGYSKIYECFDKTTPNTIEAKSIFEILNKNIAGVYKVLDRIFTYNTGTLSQPVNYSDIWQMTNGHETKWIAKVKRNTAFYVGDRFKVRVGIKSCADKVFIRDWTNEEVVPESKLLRKLISQENIKRWRLNSDSLGSVLYPHYDDNGKRRVFDIEKYPKAKAFLYKNKDTLAARKYLIDGGRNWYELWVPQNPAFWKFPKIVFPDISIEPRFYLDRNGAIVNGNCYWIVAQNQEEEELLLLIQGVANSELMTQYHDLCFNNKLYSGRRRYLSQYIEKYPIPDPNKNEAKKIIHIVRRLNEQPISEKAATSLEQELNIAVKEAFCILD